MGRAPIDPPVPRPPLYGVLAPGLLEVVDNGVRWSDGVEFNPEACAGGGVLRVRDCSVIVDNVETSDHEGLSVADPFALVHAEDCSTSTHRPRDLAGRARRGLAASESFWLAQALWDGYDLDGGGAEQEQRPLADLAADTVTSGPVSVTIGLARLERALGSCGRGRRGLIHVTSDVLELAISLGAVVRNGSGSGAVYMTAMGHLVVADAGYSGNGPNGEPADDSQWGYATSAIRVRLGAVATIPSNLDDQEQFAFALDHELNTVTVMAWRLALYEWDECCHLAAEFDVPAPLIGGTS